MRPFRGTRASQRGRAREGGFALVLSLVLVTVVAGLCVGFVRLAASTAGAQTGSVDQMRAFYLAEAGLTEAFHAVRMGRTGEIGSATNKARYGDGLVHVESLMTGDGQILLRSVANVGGGEATLGLIVEPEQPPLGFFADEDLVIEAGVLMDGFDSTERPYDSEVELVQSLAAPEEEPEEQVVGSDLRFVEVPASDHYEAQQRANEFLAILGAENLHTVIAEQTRLSFDIFGNVNSWFLWNTPFNYQSLLTESQNADLLRWAVRLRQAFDAGALFFDSAAVSSQLQSPWSVLFDQIDIRNTWIEESVLADGEAAVAEPLSSGPTSPPVELKEGELNGTGAVADDESGASAPEIAAGYNTERGGLLGSNGDVTFVGPEAGQSLVFGSVVPGVEGEVTGLGEGAVSGSTLPRALTATLEPVQLPSVGEAVDIVHGGAIPHVIAPGVDSIGALTVALGSEVIIRGPAKLVVSDLVLDGGSQLTLDTRDGDVELFITGSLDMDPASFVETTGVRSDEVSILAAPADAAATAPELEFDATSRFYGTIYAPESRVHIGSNFEIFGAVSARRLEIAQGARLHFDDESYNNAMGLPEQKSWQILELPAPTHRPPASAGAGPAPTNPPLAFAHALDDVTMSIRYISLNGTAERFSGLEADFDWSGVASVEAVERAPRIVRLEAVDAIGGAAPNSLTESPSLASASGADASPPSTMTAGDQLQAAEAGVVSGATAVADATASAAEDWSSAESAEDRRAAMIAAAVEWLNAQDWEEPGFESVGE